MQRGEARGVSKLKFTGFKYKLEVCRGNEHGLWKQTACMNLSLVFTSKSPKQAAQQKMPLFCKMLPFSSTRKKMNVAYVMFFEAWSSLGDKRLEGQVLAKLCLVSSEMFGRLALFWKQLRANRGWIGASVGVRGDLRDF